MKVYIRDWPAGSAVTVGLEERGRSIYRRVARWLAGSVVALVLEERSRYIREWLAGSPVHATISACDNQYINTGDYCFSMVGKSRLWSTLTYARNGLHYTQVDLY